MISGLTIGQFLFQLYWYRRVYYRLSIGHIVSLAHSIDGQMWLAVMNLAMTTASPMGSAIAVVPITSATEIITPTLDIVKTVS